MPRVSPIETLAAIAHSRLALLGLNGASRTTITAILNALYVASMRTEEGRSVRCCVTFANPDDPDPDSPRLIRAQYPAFTRLTTPVDFTPERVTKLSRAIDSWAGSLAIFGTARTGIVIWGFADERVHFNLSLHAEGEGFGQPGLFTVTVDGIGQLSVYHHDFFVGSLRYDEVMTEQVDALASPLIRKRLSITCRQTISAIKQNLPLSISRRVVKDTYIGKLDETIRRICIGVQRAGTGGMLIFTPHVLANVIAPGVECEYSRLHEAIACWSLQTLYAEHVQNDALSRTSLDRSVLLDYAKSESDEEDREEEITGAVRLISSMATLDGATILTPDLTLRQFAAKINSVAALGTVSLIASDKDVANPASDFDYKKFGTRHLSALRYCKTDTRSFVVVISQDGAVRAVASQGGRLLVYDNVRLKDYSSDVAEERAFRKEKLERKRRLGVTRGYTDLPKSISEMHATIWKDTDGSRRSSSASGN